MSNYWENVFSKNEGYYYDLGAASRKAILDHLTPGDSILDIGCGGGALRTILPEGHEYLGVDYAPSAIQIAAKRHPTARFMVADIRNLSKVCNENEYDVVATRHCLENQQDWKDAVRQMFRIARKRVVIVLRRPFSIESRLVEDDNNDTWVWDIGHGEFNWLARHLSVNVCYGKCEDDEVIVINKLLDDAVFDLDDFHDENHNLPLLLDLKDRFPNLKVTLFCIPSKCSVKFLQGLKDRYPWMEFAVHGLFHDTEHGKATECNFWTEQQANEALDKAEEMGCFVKGFRAPGWQLNIATVKVLKERGYWLADHKDHERYQDIKLPRYTTGHNHEVHGHVQDDVYLNNLKELATTKCNFHKNTRFRFVSEALDESHNYLTDANQQG